MTNVSYKNGKLPDDQIQFRERVRIKLIAFLDLKTLNETRSDNSLAIFEPRREKTGFLHMRKQRRRSASR